MDLIHEIIDQIYDSAVEPEKWPELLNAMALFMEETQAGGNCYQKIHLSAEPTPGKALSTVLQQIPQIQAASTESHTQDILSKHFKRALQVAQKLVTQSEQYEVVLSLLDQMPVALFIVDKQAEVLQQNEQATQILREQNELTVRDNKLVARQHKDTLELFQKIESLGTHVSGTEQIMQISVSQSEPLILVLSRVSVNDPPPVAVFVSKGSGKTDSNPDHLGQLYQLTEKESEVAEDLVQGLSIKEIAKKNHVRESTVRNQIKSVFAKTDTKRQAELVSLALKSPGRFIKQTPILDHSLDEALQLSRLGAGIKRYVSLPDHRTMAYREYGTPDGIPLLYGHSALGSSNEIAVNGDQIARTRGFRLIIPDRPGFGHSDPNPVLATKNWANDLRYLLDKLNVHQFYYIGTNFGGFFGLDVTHHLQEQLLGASLIGTGLPENLNQASRQSIALYQLLIKVAHKYPSSLRMFMNIMVRGVKQNPQRFLRMLSSNMIDKDKEILYSDYYLARLYESFTHISRAAQTLDYELRLLVEDWEWDFQPENINTPIRLWHGRQDNYIPIQQGEILAKRLKNVEFKIVEDGGHFIYFYKWDDILADIQILLTRD